MQDKQNEKAVLRRIRAFCVVCSVAVVLLFGVMALRDGKQEWQRHQADYKELLLKKVDRERNPAFYDRISTMKPEVKQVVIEEWDTVDRCVTCHLGIEDPLFAGAPQPFRTHPKPELLKHHPVEKFGCTICHGGQGLATTHAGSSHNAIANWQVPMVGGMMQSRCGVCHKDYEAIGADKLVKGRELFQQMHCAGCHVIDRQGGAVGPDLTAFADKDPGNFSYENVEGEHSKQNWVVQHFKDPKKVSPGSPMHLPAMNDYQIECLSNYVLSLSGRELAKRYTPKLRPDFIAPKADLVVPEAGLSSWTGAGNEEL